MYDLIYYIPFPIIPAVFIWLILAEKKYMGYSESIERSQKEDKEASLQTSSDKIKTYTKVFVVIFLLFLPVWSFSASEATESFIHHEIYTESGARGTITGVRDPVSFSLGPTYDVETVKKKMEDNPNRWLPDELDDHLDLDHLTRIPGRLTVYLLNKPKRYVVSYTYLAPYPVVKIYGFRIVEGEEDMTRTLDFVGERTFLYPERPDIKSIYGRL